MSIDCNIECGSYWVSSLDEWKRPTELVKEYNEINERHALLLVDYAKISNQLGDVITAYTNQVDTITALNKKVAYLEKRVGYANDKYDELKNAIKGVINEI